MPRDAAHNHVAILAEESQERSEKFRKRFDRGTAPAESKTLAKSSRTREDRTEFHAAGLVVIATIDEATGAVIATRTEKLA